jgi:hypothetical protein
MNANEMTAIRELTDMNGELRELTVDEANMVAGGEKYEGRRTYSFTVLGIHFSGDRTYGCATWDDGNGGREGICW